MGNTEKSNWLKILLPLLLSVVLSLGFFLGVKISADNSSSGQGGAFSAPGGAKINNILNFIVENYVDSLNPAILTETAIHSLLQDLDPHSAFIPARELSERIDPLLGSFEGIGIEFNILNDTVLIISPIADGPSERVGIMPGDRIIVVNDETIAGVGMTSSEVVRLLKGPKGTKVEIKVRRLGVSELLPFTIVRDRIPQFSLDVAYMVDDEIGYVKFNRFSATTHQEFRSALGKLTNSGMQRLILDLRGNTGGYLEAAIRMANEILEANTLIVYTEGRRRPRQEATSGGGGLIESKPLVILIDEWSASASEIVAGAVQDNDRGLIIGRRSFGKGLVQEQVQLVDGSALLLTVAKYYTPSGRSIQRPFNNGREEYFTHFFESIVDEEAAQPNDEDEKGDAYFTTGGRKVFGGGGIMPDIHVPIQTGERFVFVNQLLNRGFFYRFAFEYGERMRNELRGFDGANDFIERFRLKPQTYSEFLAFAAAQGLNRPSRIEPDIEATIKTYLRAYLGRVVFGVGAFFPIVNQQDRTFLRALEVLSNDEYNLLLRPFS